MTEFGEKMSQQKDPFNSYPEKTCSVCPSGGWAAICLDLIWIFLHQAGTSASLSDETCESPLNLILGITYSKQVSLPNVSAVDKPNWFRLAIKIAPQSDSQPFTHNPSKGHFLLPDRKGESAGNEREIATFCRVPSKKKKPKQTPKHPIFAVDIITLLKHIRITDEPAKHYFLH